MYWIVLNGVSIGSDTIEEARDGIEMFFISYKTAGATASIKEYDNVLFLFYLDHEFKVQEVRVGK